MVEKLLIITFSHSDPSIIETSGMFSAKKIGMPQQLKDNT